MFKKVWDELVEDLNDLDDELLDRLSFEIFCIQMERVLKGQEENVLAEHPQNKEAVILPFKRSEGDET